MIPTAFDHDNTVQHPRLDVPGETMSVHYGPNENGLPSVTSCWKMTAEELDEVKRTGRVWVRVIGSTMPPMQVLGREPFDE